MTGHSTKTCKIDDWVCHRSANPTRVVSRRCWDIVDRKGGGGFSELIYSLLYSLLYRPPQLWENVQGLCGWARYNVVDHFLKGWHMADWLLYCAYMQFKLSVGDLAGKLIRDVYQRIHIPHQRPGWILPCLMICKLWLEFITTRRACVNYSVLRWVRVLD